MTFNPTTHRRKSIRLQGYDYSQAGLYFITVCTHNRLPLFGEIVDGQMQFNKSGIVAHEEWRKTEHIRSNIVLHEFVIMPNHVHGIIQLVGADCIRPNCMRPHDMPFPECADSDDQPGRVQRAPTVGDVVRGFKSAVTKRLNTISGTSGQRFWQRNYYEHIIRNEATYLKIAEYIQTNPQRWEEDTYYV
jgi:REP element-mobilizing transposase RayT